MPTAKMMTSSYSMTVSYLSLLLNSNAGLTITVKLTGTETRTPMPILRDPRQSSRAHFQFDPPKDLSTRLQKLDSNPRFLAYVQKESQKMLDHGWKFNAQKLSDTNSCQLPSPELTSAESDWISKIKLTRVLEEKRARQAAIEKSKQSLAWEVNDVNTEDCELFDHESLDKELNAFYGPSPKDHSKINDETCVGDNAALSTTWVTMPAKHLFQAGNSSEFHMNPNVSFTDSGISLEDQFPTDFRKMSTTSIDSGNLFIGEFDDQFSTPDITTEDLIEFSNAPSTVPVFPTQEPSEANRDYFRSLYCNDNGVGEGFLDAPYDLEGFVTTDDVNQFGDNGTQNQYVGSPYDPQAFSTHDVNLSYSQKMQYTFAFPGQFLGYNVPPTANMVVQPGLVSSNTMVATNPNIPVQVDSSKVSKQPLATSKIDVAYGPCRSTAPGNQSLTELQAKAKSAMMKSVRTSAPSIPAARKLIPNTIATPSPVRVNTYLPPCPKIVPSSKLLPSYRQTNLLPGYDTDSDSDNHDDVMSRSSPSNLIKLGVSPVDRLVPGKSKADFDKITGTDFNLKRSTPRAVLSTPVNPAQQGVQGPIGPALFANTPTGSLFDPTSKFIGYQTWGTPSTTDPSTPSTPSTPSVSTLAPYQSSYTFETSPTATRPGFRAVLRGQVLSPKKITPERQAFAMARSKAKAQARARKYAAAIAKKQEATAKEAARGASEQPPKKKVRRSKPNKAE